MIEFECTHCHKAIRLGDDKAGRSGRCPHCQEPVTVPGIADVEMHDKAFTTQPENAYITLPGVNDPSNSAGHRLLRFLGNLAGWFFGIVFLIFFFSTVLSYPLVSLFALAGALLVFPPIHDRLKARLQIDITPRWRTIGGVVLFFVYMTMHTNAMTEESRKRVEQKTAEAALEREKLRKEAENSFPAKKASIMTEASELLESGHAKEARDLVTPYKSVVDPDFVALVTKVEAKAQAIENEAKKKDLLNALSNLQNGKATEKAAIYDQLSSIEPANQEYRSKASTYKAQAEAEAAKLKADQEAATAKAQRVAQGLAWRYLESKDEMTQKTVTKALVDSSSTLSFGFPYSGIQRATLQLRKHPRWGSDVIIQIEKGQFLCNDYDGCSVTVRFGSGKPQRFSAVGPDDNDTTYIFLQNYSSFVSQMRKVDEVVIEAKFYQEGNRAMKFATDDLNWK
ncbi:hypothetical protein [Pseudomonas putida]|uniref:Uncharacterized protein n=1 Tax=Pseudomonas putida TaxID=303 RepID=A0A8I1JIJ6_PSEPU|nr:hypothetical protein [Pseudomonas putida]MBI6882594.1 hypothetical protein [Pseudomonas putida]